MNTKPFTPKIHGFNDYLYGAILLVVPPLLGLNKKAQRLYRVLGVEVMGYNAITDQPLGLTPMIDYNTTHFTIDCANVAAMALTTLYKPIKKDKRALAFNLTMVALAVVNVALTDWDAPSSIN